MDLYAKYKVFEKVSEPPVRETLKEIQTQCQTLKTEAIVFDSEGFRRGFVTPNGSVFLK